MTELANFVAKRFLALGVGEVMATIHRALLAELCCPRHGAVTFIERCLRVLGAVKYSLVSSSGYQQPVKHVWRLYRGNVVC